MRFPISCTSSITLSFHEPPVSMETEKKMCVCVCFPKSRTWRICWQLLDRLRFLPVWMCHVSVSPHTCPAPLHLSLKVFLFGIGINVVPAGRLPSCMSPTGSLISMNLSTFHFPSNYVIHFDCGVDVSVHFFGMLDHVGHEHQQYFHIYLCVALMLGIPVSERLKTLMASSGNLSPTDDIVGAISQSPECGDGAARY